MQPNSSSSRSDATSGSYSTSSGTAGTSQSSTGTYTKDSASSFASSYQASGGYSSNGLDGTFTTDQASSSSAVLHDQGTLTTSGGVATQLGTFTRDTDSAWHDNGARYRASAAETLSLNRTETSSKHRHDEGKSYGPGNLRVISFSQDDHYFYESSGHDEGNFSTPAGDTFSSETWNTDDFATAHTDYHAAGSISLLGIYSFDSFSYEAGASGHSERYNSVVTNYGTLTIDSTSSGERVDSLPKVLKEWRFGRKPICGVTAVLSASIGGSSAGCNASGNRSSDSPAQLIDA